MFKVFTIFKYAVAYDSNAIWDCYACKLFAPFKGIPFNAVYGLRYFYAFSECKSLENLEIPYGVTDIGFMAFYNCKNLKNITIPTSLNYINSYAFSECESLETVTIISDCTSKIIDVRELDLDTMDQWIFLYF